MKFTVEKEEVKEYKIETQEAEVTVKKEIVIEETRPITEEEKPVPVEERKLEPKPKVKEEVELTKKLKLKKKPEEKPSEKPVEETFAIPLAKKPEPVEETKEEVFAVTLPEKPKVEKLPEEVVESVELTVKEKETKPEVKSVETVEEKLTVVVQKEEIIKKEEKVEEVILPKKKIVEEEDEKTLKIKKKKKDTTEAELVKKPEEPVSETFEIPLEKKIKPEEPVEEKVTFDLPKKPKPKVPEEAEEELKVVIPEKKKKEYKITEESAEVTVKKKVEEEKEVAVVIKKKKPEKEVKEEVVEEFKIPKKPKEKEPEEPVEEKFTVEVPKKTKPKVTEDVEEELKVVLPETKKKEYKITEESAEVTVKKKVEEKITKEEEKEAAFVIKKKKPEKVVKEEVVEEFKIPKKPKEKEPEEPVEEKFTVEVPKKPKPIVTEEVEEELKVVLPETKKKEYKITEESAEVTVKKKVEEKITKEEEKEVAVVIKKKKPEKEVKEVVEEFKIPKKPQEKEPEEEEPTKISFELPKKKVTPKAPVEEEETFKLELPVEKKFEVVEESAEVTVKKEVEVDEVDKTVTFKKPEKKVKEEKEEAVVIKRKKKEERKVVEEVTEEFKIPKKPEEKAPEEEATKIVFDLPKKKKVPEVVEAEEESLKITLPAEVKPKTVVEESAEITVKKVVEPEEVDKKITIKKEEKKVVEEKEETVVLKKKEISKKEEKTVVEEFKIPKKPKEEVPEEPTKLIVELPKKKKVPEVTEEEESLKIVLPHERKPEVKEEEAAELTVIKPVEVEEVEKVVKLKKDKKKVVEEKEESVVFKMKKEEKKKVEEKVTEEFVIPKKPKEKVEPEELAEVSVELPKKKKVPQFQEEEESLEIKLPSKKKPQVTEESAEITVKKEVVIDEEVQKVTISKKEKKEMKIEEEKVEFAIKRPKKKPEPKEAPVEESFTIGRKPEPVSEPEKPEDVEETFKIVAKPKPKPKVVAQDEEESISIQIPAEKPKYKSEEVSEETKITIEAPKKPEEKEYEMIKETIELIAVSSYISEKTDTLSITEGERVYLIEKTSSDWWFVKKTLTNETGFIPSDILQDSDSYTHYMKETLDKKIEKLPVLRKPRPGEKMTGPKFVKKLQPLHILDGQTAELSCQVSGNPRPTITWFRQTAIIKPSSEFQIFYDDDNVTTLIIREVFPEDAGTFTVVAKNAAGFASCSSELIVEAPLSDHGGEMTPMSRRSLSRQSSLADILEGIPPVFSEKPRDKLIEEGKPVEMVCKVTGVPEPKVTWLRNQKLLKESERIEIETISEDLDTVKVVVKIKKTKPEDAGTYDIIAENREGKSVTSLILNIKEKPKKPTEEPPAFIQTYSDLITTEKDSVTLTVKVLGSPPPEVTWYKNGKVIKPSKTTKVTQEKDVHTLTIPASSVTDTGEYKCVATNPQGKTEHTAKITVQKTDVDFVDKLNDLEVNERETAMFVVQVSHPDAEITWHKDGERIKETEKFKIIKEGKFRKLVVSDASINDEGEYTCVLGEKECTADLVVVELPPDFKGEMNDVTVAKEETATFQVELTKGDARARWFKNGKEIQFSEHVLLKIDGKRQKLIIYNATFEDAGTYTCAVGEKKRTAKLKVEAPTVEFTAKLPEKVLVPQDTDATFTVELSRPDVEVQWLKNGQPVPQKDEKFRFIRERNTFKMVVQGVQKDDTAEYTCVAGNVKTSTKLQVQEASAEFTLKLRDVLVKESDTAILLVEVTRETFEVRWMKDGQTLRPSERVVMEKEGCRRRLIIKETSLDDKGLYTCVLEEKMCSSTLTVEATPRVITDKRTFSGKRGSNLPIPIEFVALPSPKIEWLCKGKPISNDKKHTIENYKTKSVLTVKKLEDPDVGNYVLKLSNKCGETKTDITLSIIDKPRPPGTPCASEIANDSLTLSWKVPESDGGSPITNYIIEFHDRNTLRWSVYNEKQTITDSFTKVTKLKSGEEYMFRIIAVNEVGKSDPSPGTKYILVKEPSAGEPPAVVEHLQPVVAGLKKPAVMKCRISGQPTPTIKWLKNGKDLLIVKNITTTYENQIATLNIGETSDKSCGTYSCTATNPLGTVETSAELKIQEPPSIKYDENLKNVRLKSSTEYILPVQVFGFPSPEIVWMKNGRVLESTRHTLVQVKEDSTTITIRQVENTDSGTYTLQLSNPAGTTKYDFRLFVLDKPLPPEGPIAFHKIDRDSVTIAWQPPSIGGSEVMSYVIERCETKRKTWIEVTTVTSEVLTCSVPDLTEGVEYAFRVLAVNEYGRSEPLKSDPVIPKSLFNKPLSPKGPFTSSNMTPTSFTLSWLAPDNDGGSPIIEYIVEKKEVNKKAWQKVGTTDSRSLSMEVTGLKEDTAYNFRVSCRNEVGTSPPFAPEDAITPGQKIAPPSPPVGPLTITHMTNKTLTLSWKPPINTGGAELTAYIIEKRESTKKAWNRLETLEPHITTYTVHNLSDKHEYFFRVFAENPAGLSPPLVTEKPIKLTSTAERPTPPTAPLEMVATGPSSILIEWGKPESDGGSPILGYTVALRDTRRIMWMEVGQVDGETQKLQIKDLYEGHEYLVRIMARNEIGISDPLEPEEPVKVVRPVGFKESEKMEVDEKTISVSYSTETSSSWIREANVEPLLRSYTKHVLVGRNEYFFKLWHFSESLYK